MFVSKFVNGSNEIQFLKENDDQINNKNNFKGPGEDIADLALWMIILLIVVPTFLVIVVTLVCCNYICYWCRPYPYQHSRMAPLFVESCGRQTTNFNA